MRGCARTNTKHICTWSQFLKPQASELRGSCQMFLDFRSPDVCLLHTPPLLLTKRWNSNHWSSRISSLVWMCSCSLQLFPHFSLSLFFVLFVVLPHGNTWKLKSCHYCIGALWVSDEGMLLQKECSIACQRHRIEWTELSNKRMRKKEIEHFYMFFSLEIWLANMSNKTKANARLHYITHESAPNGEHFCCISGCNSTCCLTDL